MKKKILFCIYNLNMGGIPTAMLSLLKCLDSNKYDITLLIEKKYGFFIDNIPNHIKIINYDLDESNNGNRLFRKIKNRLKLIKWIIKIWNKYDFSACYTTYSIPSSILARYASKNNAIWIHGDYYEVFNHCTNKIKEFFNKIKVNKYKNIIFVSNSSKENFIKVYPELTNKCKSFNNVIDYNNIIIKSKEKLEINKNHTTFLHVGRHLDDVKKISLIINNSYKLKKEGYDFEVWLIGDGPSTNDYKKMVQKLKIQKNVIFLDKKQNPFPYYKKADALILSSKYEGNPVVFVEAMVLNKPIVTTNVSDALINIDRKFGIVTNNDEESLYLGMKKFLDEGFIIKEKFNPQKFNNEILKEIEEIINE